jgi:hypothetical protein
MKKIDLPRKYLATDSKYERFNGWNKISYSQNGSFKDYREQYIQNYILDIKSASGIFASYGSDCGDYLNPYDDRESYPLLSTEDVEILDTLKNNHPAGADFEYEIVINLEPFGLEKTCVQAFTDRQYFAEDKLNVNDYKTLTVKTKKAYYESDDYKQLSIYGYGLEELGFTIGEMYVVGLGRLGNTTEKGNKNVLRLSGEIIRVEKPYDREKAVLAIKEIAENCIEISEYFRVYNKYFK